MQHVALFLILMRWIYSLSLVQDVALASVSMRPIPFAPVLEKLSLSDMRYGSVRRFYVETPEDNAIPMVLQESMINSRPPEKVFRLKGADHSPFFSKPQALHKLLVEISEIPSPWENLIIRCFTKVLLGVFTDVVREIIRWNLSELCTCAYHKKWSIVRNRSIA